jgi:hypothetical protein
VFTDKLSLSLLREKLTQKLSERPGARRSLLIRTALLALYLLMTVQFVGCYLFLSRPYIDLHKYAYGYERLPFQPRLLLAPLFRWSEHSLLMIRLASHWSTNSYFFPHGIGPGGVLQFYIDVPCVLIAGWVALRLYQAASRRRLLGWLVYPLFLVLCVITYILHAVQNYRFIYDMPSLMFFALGLYLIYFRKPTILFVALFAVATLNRETTLLLIPFFLLSTCIQPENALSPTTVEASGQHSIHLSLIPAGSAPHRFEWKRVFQLEVAVPAALMLAYWAAWHLFIFHLFRNNASEYYSRLNFNWYCFRRLRYYPQIFSAFGYLLPFVILFRKHLHDAQLRLWMWAIPAWVALMAIWGILVETRVYGELLPFVACAATLIAEEAITAAVRRRQVATDSNDDDRVHLVRAA